MLNTQTVPSEAPKVSPRDKPALLAATSKRPRGSPPRTPITPRSAEHHDHNSVHSCNCPEFVVETVRKTLPGHTDIPVHYIKPKSPFFVTEYEREFTWPRSMPPPIPPATPPKAEDATKEKTVMIDDSTQTPALTSSVTSSEPPLNYQELLQRLRGVLIRLYNRGFDQTMNSAAIDEIDRVLHQNTPHLSASMTTVLQRLNKRLQRSWVADEGPEIVALCREAVELLEKLML